MKKLILLAIMASFALIDCHAQTTTTTTTTVTTITEGPIPTLVLHTNFTLPWAWSTNATIFPTNGLTNLPTVTINISKPGFYWVMGHLNTTNLDACEPNGYCMSQTLDWNNGTTNCHLGFAVAAFDASSDTYDTSYFRMMEFGTTNPIVWAVVPQTTNIWYSGSGRATFKLYRDTSPYP